MGVEPQQAAGFYAANGEIAVDHQCKRCAYNLRGLREDGRCPECGTPIGLSTRGDLLCFASPDWVDKVAHGLTIICWMLLVGVVGGVLSIVASRLISPVVGQGVALLAALGSYYGVWLLTEPDPGGIGEDPHLTARKVVRLTLIVGLCSQALGLLQVSAAGLPKVVEQLLWLLIAVAGLVGLVGEFAKFNYYAALARRVPDDALAKRVRFLKWAFTLSLAIITLGGVAVVSAAPAMLPAPAALGVLVPVLMCAMVPVGLALLVFGLMNVAMLLRLRKTIREQARRARATWAAALETTGVSPV